jgi:hypothetical protein
VCRGILAAALSHTLQGALDLFRTQSDDPDDVPRKHRIDRDDPRNLTLEKKNKFKLSLDFCQVLR